MPTVLSEQPLDLLSDALRRNLQRANETPEDVSAIVYAELRRELSDEIIIDVFSFAKDDLPLRIEAFLAQPSERVRWRPPGPVAAIHVSGNGATVVRCDDALMFIDPDDRAQTVRVPRLTSSAALDDAAMTGDGEGTVTFWNRAEARVDARFAAHRAAVTQVVFVLDAAFSCAADGSIVQWVRTPDWEEVARFDAPAGISTAAGFERSLVVGCRNGDILEIRPDGTTLHAREHVGAVSGIAYTNTGVIVSAGADRMLCIWESGRPEWVARADTGHTIGITGLVAAEYDDLVATYAPDRRVRVWRIPPDTPVPELAFDLSQHKAALTMVQFGGEGVDLLLISGSADGAVIRWDHDGDPMASHHRHTAAVRAGAVHKAAILTGGDDARLDRCDFFDMTVEIGWGVSEFTSALDAVAVCNAGRVEVLSGEYAGIVAKTTATSVMLRRDTRRALLWREGARAATEWDLRGSEKQLSFDAPIVRCGYVNDTPIVVLDDGNVVIGDETVRTHDGAITAMVTASGEVVTGAQDGKIVAVDNIYKSVYAVGSHATRITVLAARAGLIASGSLGGELAVAGYKAEIFRNHHDASISHLAFGSVPDTLISVCEDHFVTVWNYRSGARLATWAGHRDRITALLVDERSHLIYTASLDRTVRAWDYEGKPRGVVYGDYPFSAMTSIHNALPGAVLVGDDAGGLLTLTYRGAGVEAVPKGSPRKKIVKKAARPLRKGSVKK